MPSITSHNGVYDWTQLVYGTLLALIVLNALAGLLVRHFERRGRLEAMFKALYQKEEPGSNSSFYPLWREKYIEAVEQRFGGKRIWRICLKEGAIPPIQQVFVLR
ncbi:MAG TPA: hypothetical protein VLG09_06230 [Candidatus Saccharimonadales bacterium]|nr:hypothetical protein [Candidatus Saccharimonadales bacterium]